MRRRLLLLVTRSELGGAQKYVYALATAVSAAKYEIAVACGGREWLCRALTAKGVPVFSLPPLASRPNSSAKIIRSLFDPVAFSALCRLVREYRPDILHTNSTKAGFLGRLAARRARLPVVVHTWHGLPINEIMSGNSRRLLLFSERLASKLSHALVAVSDRDRCDALCYRLARPDLIKTVFNGVSPRGVPPRHEIVGTVANLYANKGLPIFLEAAKHVLTVAPRTIFVIVGDGPLRNSLLALASQLGLGQSFLMTGSVEEPSQYFKAFDLFVLPSLKEGLPFALLEAMAYGLPVVSTEVGGMPEVNIDGETGLVVPSSNPRALADAILNLLRNSERAAEMGASAAARVEVRYSLTRMLQETEALYDGLAGSA